MSAAVKQSPAPVPSTTVVGGGTALATTAPPRRSSAPSPPSVTATAAAASRPSSAANSARLTTTRSARRSTSGATGRAGAALSTNIPVALRRGGGDGQIGHLQHGEHGVGLPQLARHDRVVGARGDDDRGLAVVVDRHEGVPGRQLGVRGDADEVDAVGAQQREGLVRGRVGADRGDQRDLRAEPPGRQRLVGPLAAGHPAQLVRGERLTGLAAAAARARPGRG